MCWLEWNRALLLTMSLTSGTDVSMPSFEPEQNILNIHCDTNRSLSPLNLHLHKIHQIKNAIVSFCLNFLFYSIPFYKVKILYYLFIYLFIIK